MPVLDGYQATQAIRALPHPERASTPIVALTANAMPTDRQLDAGTPGAAGTERRRLATRGGPLVCNLRRSLSRRVILGYGTGRI